MTAARSAHHGHLPVQGCIPHAAAHIAAPHILKGHQVRGSLPAPCMLWALMNLTEDALPQSSDGVHFFCS